jgi:aldehyde dehydrogenase (NAD+)
MNFLQELNIQTNNLGVSTGNEWIKSTGTIIESYSPVDGKLIGTVTQADDASYEQTILTAEAAFKEWRNW